MRLKIDPSLCVGHGRCYAEFPERFADDEEGHGTVREERSNSSADQDPDAVLAVTRCPEGAITFEE